MKPPWLELGWLDGRTRTHAPSVGVARALVRASRGWREHRVGASAGEIVERGPPVCQTRGMGGRRWVVESLGLVMAAGVVVSACAGTSTPPAATAAPTSAVATPEPATPEASLEASAAVTVDYGEVGVTPRGSRVTVHSFGPSERSVAPPAGAAWQEIDLEWCLPPTIVSDVTLGNIRYELNLELSDGTTIEPEAEADSPDEVYASEGTFSANDCVRGALVFAVPTGATPEHLLLVGPYGGMRWRLS